MTATRSTSWGSEAALPRVVFVSARPKWNSTDILLTAGRRYLLQPSPEDEWRDARRWCGAAGWDSALLWPLHFLKRNRSANWLGLVAVVGEQESFVFNKGDAGAIAISPSIDGHLRFYANDASFMYWNNYGEIRVTISDVTTEAQTPLF